MSPCRVRTAPRRSQPARSVTWSNLRRSMATLVSAQIRVAAMSSCPRNFWMSVMSMPIASSRVAMVREYQNLWGQAALAILIRGAIHRLHDQKLRRLTCPHESTPHTFWYSRRERRPVLRISPPTGLDRYAMDFAHG